MSLRDGGPAFPRSSILLPNDNIEWGDNGMSLRDWFATFAPTPTVEEVNAEGERDRLANPHGDSYKPARRSAAEIRAELRYRYADSMVAAREKGR